MTSWNSDWLAFLKIAFNEVHWDPSMLWHLPFLQRLLDNVECGPYDYKLESRLRDSTPKLKNPGKYVTNFVF